MARFLLSALVTLMVATSQAEAQTGCPPFTWDAVIAPGDQTMEIVDRITAEGGRTIVGVQFGPLTGEFAKVYIFIEFVDGCFSRAVSLGRYAYLEAIGNTTDYHLDLYTRDAHATLNWYNTLPSYDDIRAIAFREFGLR